MGLFSALGGLFGGKSQKKAADKAAQLQFQATQTGIAEQARQFDQTRQDYSPFLQAGTQALSGLSDLTGLNGGTAQQSSIDMLRQSPIYSSLYGAGEEAILANASATGGLRGGNTQRSLADFGSDTLSGLIQQQVGNYGGIAGMGLGATGAVSSFGANSVAQQNDLRGQGAAAKAQAQLVRGGINAQNFQNFGSVLDSAVSSFVPGGGGFNWGKLF